MAAGAMAAQLRAALEAAIRRSTAVVAAGGARPRGTAAGGAAGSTPEPAASLIGVREKTLRFAGCAPVAFHGGLTLARGLCHPSGSGSLTCGAIARIETIARCPRDGCARLLNKPPRHGASVSISAIVVHFDVTADDRLQRCHRSPTSPVNNARPPGGRDIDVPVAAAGQQAQTLQGFER